MPQSKIRVGEVEAEEMLPSIDALAEMADDAGIQGGRGNRRYAEEIEVDENGDYLYLFFTKEVEEERRMFHGDEEEEDPEDIEIETDSAFFARSMRFILRDDGYYVFESTRGVSGRDAIEYIFNDHEAIGLEFNRFETFPPSWMRSFFDRTPLIRKVRLKDIGELEEIEDEVDDDLLELVQDAGGPAERIEFSTSGRDNDLAAADIIKAFADLSDIDFVNGKDANNELTKLNQSGRLTFSYPADLEHLEYAERMYAASDRILGNLDEESD